MENLKFKNKFAKTIIWKIEGHVVKHWGVVINFEGYVVNNCAVVIKYTLRNTKWILNPGEKNPNTCQWPKVFITSIMIEK